MGARAVGLGHHVCPMNGHQVLGTGSLCGQMDQDPDATGDHRLGVLDDVLRWITNEEGRQGWAGFCFPLGVLIRYAICIHLPVLNNVAKYEALVNGLCIAIELDI